MQAYQNSPFFAGSTQDFAQAMKKIARALPAMPATFRNSEQEVAGEAGHVGRVHVRLHEQDEPPEGHQVEALYLTQHSCVGGGDDKFALCLK